MARLSLDAPLDLLRRHPVGVICGLLCLPLAGLAWFLHADLAAIEARHQEAAETGATTLAAIGGARSLRAQTAETRAAAAEIDRHLIDAADIADNYNYFYEIEDRLRLRLSDLRQLAPTSPPAGSAYRTVPFSLRVTGPYEQVAAWIHAIETGPRLGRIRDFNVERNDAAGRTATALLTVELLAKR